jgi:hypothetical protein
MDGLPHEVLENIISKVSDTEDVKSFIRLRILSRAWRYHIRFQYENTEYTLLNTLSDVPVFFNHKIVKNKKSPVIHKTPDTLLLCSQKHMNNIKVCLYGRVISNINIEKSLINSTNTFNIYTPTAFIEVVKHMKICTPVSLCIRHRDNLYKNKEPRWNAVTRCYMMRCHPQVKIASQKNIIICDEQGNEILHLGKTKDNTFLLCFDGSILTLLEAYSISLTMFY